MKSKHTVSLWIAVLITALAPVIWGSTYIVTTEILPNDRPVTAALLRVLPAGLLLLLIRPYWPTPAQWPRLAILALLNIALFQALLFVAAYRLPGGLAAVVGAMQPLFVMLLIWRINHRRPPWLGVWGALLGITGMTALLLTPATEWDPIGVAAALASAVSMAAGTFLSQRWQTRIPVIAFTGWQLLVGGLFLLPFAWLLDPPLPSLTTAQIAGYVYLSLFGAGIAYVLWFRGIARLSPVAVSSLGLLSPVTAVILGWLILDQKLEGIAFLGMIAVLLSILVVQLAANGSRTPPDTPRLSVAPSGDPAKPPNATRAA